MSNNSFKFVDSAASYASFFSVADPAHNPVLVQFSLDTLIPATTAAEACSKFCEELLPLGVSVVEPVAAVLGHDVDNGDTYLYEVTTAASMVVDTFAAVDDLVDALAQMKVCCVFTSTETLKSLIEL